MEFICRGVDQYFLNMALIVVPFTTTSQLYNSATLPVISHVFETIELTTTLSERQNVDIKLTLTGGNGKLGPVCDYVVSSSTPDIMLHWSGSAQGSGIYEFGSGSVLQALNQGTALRYDVSESPQENHDRSQTSDTDPNVLQGANTIEWDVFPSVEAEVPLPERERDLTRYHKAYSFTRVQPVRIRLIRR